MSFEEWCNATGNEKLSIIADPLFEDVSSFDFRLKESSPAYKLGFNPVDFSKVGPRPKQERTVFKTHTIEEKKVAD